MDCRLAKIGCLVATLGGIVLSGCAASSSQDYKAPTQDKVENTKVIDAPFDTTWDRLIKNLSKSFFVINNVEKASHILNVSYSADKPSDLIDCGERTRTYVSGGGSKQVFVYNPADASTYKVADDNGNPFLVVRDSRLEGRANIYVAPSNDATEISVNVRYILTISGSAQALHPLYGFPVGAAQPFSDTTYNFDTNAPLNRTDSGERLVCATNGKLEMQILEAAQ